LALQIIQFVLEMLKVSGQIDGQPLGGLALGDSLQLFYLKTYLMVPLLKIVQQKLGFRSRRLLQKKTGDLRLQ